jgi:kanamycin nucleotidyltransferase
MDHERRMELARQVTDILVRKHEDILAVAVYGSTAKNEDREHSDLELYVLTKADERFYRFVHEGIVIEVFFITKETAEREAKVPGTRWPLYADVWLNPLVMHDPQDILPALATTGRAPDPAAFERRLPDALTSIYEDLCKMRNHAAAGEGELARFTAHDIVVEVAMFLGLLNRRYFHGLRDLLARPKEFRALPEHFWEDYPRLLAVDVPTPELLEKAERLYTECRGLRPREALAEPPTLEAQLTPTSPS